MIPKYTRQEKRARNEKRAMAIKMAKSLLERAVRCGVVIRSLEETGRELGFDMKKFKAESQTPASVSDPYFADWELRFSLDLQAFTLDCLAPERRLELTLDHSEGNVNALIKALYEEPQMTRFNDFIQESMNERVSQFNEAFKVIVKDEKDVKDRFSQMVDLLVIKHLQVLTKNDALDAVARHLRESTLPNLPWESRLFGELPGKKALQAAEQGRNSP